MVAHFKAHVTPFMYTYSMFLSPKILRDTDPSSWLFNSKYRRRVRRKRRGITITVNGQDWQEWVESQR